MNSSRQRFDVVIVGFGPAGAVAACWLGHMGLKVLVLEKSRTIWEIPRAIALDHEILRVFQNLGVVDRILPYTAPFGASEHYGVEGQLIRRIDVVAPPYPLGFLPNMVFTQPAVEAILRERAMEQDCVTARLGCEVTGIREEDGEVLVEARHEDGTAESVRACYAIGCDGAASSVRRMLEIPLDDLGFDEPWLVVDILVKDEAIAGLPSVCAQYCDPARPYTYIIGPGNHRRWEIMLNPGEDPLVMQREENVWPLLSRWLRSQDGKMWRASSYRFHALVAAKWRHGRVFLAGDAAHQQPPFLGQGMCQGIRDVTNLCWKLRSALSGDNGDDLLDTYEQERREHTKNLIYRIKEIGSAICIRDRKLARERDEEFLRRGGGKAPVTTRQEIVPGLTSGLVDPTRPAAGLLFPQPWIETAGGPVLLDELTGPGWRLFLDGRSINPAPSLQDPRLRTVVFGKSEFPERDGVAARWFDSHGCKGAIVRPDHYVYCGISGPAEAVSCWGAVKTRSGLSTDHTKKTR